MKWWRFVIIIGFTLGIFAYRKTIQEQTLEREKMREMTDRFVSTSAKSESDLSEIRKIVEEHNRLLDAVVQREQQLSDMLSLISEKDAKIVELDHRLDDAGERADSLEKLVEEKKTVLAERDDLIERAKKYTYSLKRKISSQSKQDTSKNNVLESLRKSNAEKDFQISELKEELKKAKSKGSAGNDRINKFAEPRAVGSSSSSSRTIRRIGED